MMPDKKGRPMLLKDLVHYDIKKIDPMSNVSDIAKLMRLFKIGSAFVETKGEFIGIVTESDLVRIALAEDVPYDTPVHLLMSAPIIEIDIGKPVIEANHVMYFNGIRHLGISERGKIVGMISVRDLVYYFSTDKKSPLYELGDIIKPLTILAHRNIETIEAGSSVQLAAQRMKEKKIGSLFITEDGRYSGIIAEADLVRKVVGYGLSPSKIPVGVVMNTPIVDIDISRSVQEANEVMSRKKVRHLAVTENGEIVGILSIRDLIGMVSIRDLPRFFQLKNSLV